MKKKSLTEQHSFINELIFRAKIAVHIGKRTVKNLVSPVKKFAKTNLGANEPVIAFSESDLWNPFDTKDNWILTAGKIENLRIAAKRINGLEIKAGEVFSFWQHIGQPTARKGYVIGREIREGCVVPTIAGGLCQLSNALYDAALNANFEIIERHKHTKVIQGSLAEKDLDATVKWNYIDLRFKPSTDVRLEVTLTSDKLLLVFKSAQESTAVEYGAIQFKNASKINDCYSCGNTACFKFPDRSKVSQTIASTTFIVDEKWPEFENYLSNIGKETDRWIVPLKKRPWIKTQKHSWSSMRNNVDATQFQGIFRALKLRWIIRQKKNVFEASMKLDQHIAIAAAKKIKSDSSHLVISQNLLPYLYETGVLGGRTFDVLMTRLPLQQLHERLDNAHAMHSESLTLNDFRASEKFIQLEKESLNKARNIITPHVEIADIFEHKAQRINWHLPSVSTTKTIGAKKILFPASALGRKGAYEMKRLVQELGFQLVIAGRALEYEGFWKDVIVEYFKGDFSEIGLVIYPTFVEHQPRLVLKAIALDIPVITTKSCGIDASNLVKIVATNEYDAIKYMVQEALLEMK